MDDYVVISIRIKTLKLMCIILASWGFCFEVYQLNATEKLRLYAIGRAVPLNFSYSNENGTTDVSELMDQHLTTMSYLLMNKSHSEVKRLRHLYSHINKTAASILREKLISKGFESAETLQIYVHVPKSGKPLAVNFPSKSKLVTRPDGSPWLPNVDTCAVVGNGGILKGSNCGEEINAHDLVFRSNMARIDGFIQDVGNKTNLMSINCQETASSMKCLRNTKCRNKLLKYINVYLKDSIIWLSKLHGYYKTDRDYKNFVYQLGKYRKGLIYGYPRKFLSPPVQLFWNTTKIPSSGLFLHAVASNVCKKISLYGFYPFNSTESGRELPYHYYQDVTFVNKHNMPEEYSELIKLNQMGAIRLVTGNCTW